jgi:hypothetical protein
MPPENRPPIDLSGIDDEPVVDSRPPIDLSGIDDDVSFEEPVDTALTNIKEGVYGAAGGATVGAAIPQLTGLALEKAGQIGQYGVEKLSPYTPEQLLNVSLNKDQFNAIDPQDTLQKVGGEFEAFNRIANQKEKDAYANLTVPLLREEYRSTVAQAAAPFTKEIPTDTAEFLKAQEEFTPKINRPHPVQVQADLQLEQFAEKEARKRAAAINAANMGTLPQEVLLKKYQDAKEEILKSKEGFAFVPDAKAAQQALDKEAVDVANAGIIGTKKATESFQTGLAKEFPELKGRMFKDSEKVGELDFEKILSQYSPGEKLSGEESYKFVKKVRAMAYDKNDNLRISGDAAKAVQKRVRDVVGDKNPEASELLASMSEDIKQIDRLEDAGYLKRNMDVSKSSDEFIDFGEKQQKQVLKDLAPNLHASGVQVSNDVAGRLLELKKVLPEPLYKEMELAALKQAMKNPKHQLKLSGFELAFAAMRPALASLNIGKKTLESAEGSLASYRAAKALQKAGSVIRKGTKLGAGIGALVGGPVGAFAGELAGEALDVEPSGALPEKVESDITTKDPYSAYWQEKGVRDPEEQIQRARAASFKQGIPASQINQSKIPGAYAKPEKKSYMESVMQAEKAGTLEKNYVEKLTPKDDLEGLMNTLKSFDDKASQEYSNVLQGLANSTESQKEAILFTLNQQPAFRQSIKKAKGIA